MKTVRFWIPAAAALVACAACTPKSETAVEESSAPAAEASTPAAEASNCPAIAVTSMPLGGGATFTAEIAPPSETATYNWSVSAGTITSGQGTSSVSVDAPPGLVTASVEVGGLDPNCVAVSSETAEVE